MQNLFGILVFIALLIFTAPYELAAETAPQAAIFNGRQYPTLAYRDWTAYGRPANSYEIGEIADEKHSGVCADVLSALNEPYQIDTQSDFFRERSQFTQYLWHHLGLMMHSALSERWQTYRRHRTEVNDKLLLDFNNDGVMDTVYRFIFASDAGYGSTLWIMPPDVATKAEQSTNFYEFLWQTKNAQPRDSRLWLNKTPLFKLSVTTPSTAPVKFRDSDRLIELINLNGHSYFLMAYSRHLDDNTPFNVYLFEPQTTHSHEYMCRFDARFIVGAFPPSEGVPAIYSTAPAEPTPR